MRLPAAICYWAPYHSHDQEHPYTSRCPVSSSHTSSSSYWHCYLTTHQCNTHATTSSSRSRRRRSSSSRRNSSSSSSRKSSNRRSSSSRRKTRSRRSSRRRRRSSNSSRRSSTAYRSSQIIRVEGSSGSRSHGSGCAWCGSCSLRTYWFPQ